MESSSTPLTFRQSDALRIATFLATAMVVLRHSFNLHRYYPGGNPWMPVMDFNIATQRFFTEFTNVAIPAFFFMSGFLFFRDLADWRECFPKWRKRLKTLLLPYILWNLILLCLVLGAYSIPSLRPQMSVTYNVQLSSGWFLDRMTLHPIMGHFWYIRTLMIFLLFAPILYLLLHNQALSFILLFILARCWIPIDTGVLSTEGALYFYCGCWIATHGGLPQAMPVWQWMWIVPILAYNHFMPFFRPGCMTVPGGIAMSLFVGWQVCLLLADSMRTRQWLLQLNQHSFFLYALHAILVSGITLMMSRFQLHTPLNSFLAYWLCFAIVLLTCLAISYLVKRIAPSCHSILTGGR